MKKYSLDSVCGPPKIDRRPAPAPPATGTEKESEKSEQDETTAFWIELTDSFRE